MKKGVAVFYINVGHLNCDQVSEFIDKTKKNISEVIEDLKKAHYSVLFLPTRIRETEFEIIAI